MDIYSHLFVVKIVMRVWKDENKWKRDRGWPIFLKKYRAIRLIAAGGGQEAIVVALYSEDPSSNPVEA